MILVKAMLPEDIERLPEWFAAYVRDQDQFLVGQGHSLATFCTQAYPNRLAAANGAQRRANGVSYGRAELGDQETPLVGGEQL